MTHLTDGQLRAHLDAELDAADARHLGHCPECQSRLAALAGQQTRVSAQLAALTSNSPAPSAQFAWQQFQSKYKSEIEKEKMMSKKLWPKLRPLFAGVVALTTIVAAFTFMPVQQAFSAFLSLFRVQQVAVLPIDPSSLNNPVNNESVGRQMSAMFSDSMQVTKQASEPQTVASAAEAGQLAGFTVRTLSADTPDQFIVSDSTAFDFTVNREQAQGVLNELGHSDLQLPASIDGAKISVSIPAGVATVYGDCGEAPGARTEDDAPRLSWRTCVTLTQIPSPSVDAPLDVNLAQLAEIALQVTGMSAEEARAFSQKIDWSTTLVIPVPANATTYKEVTVDGVTGQFITYSEDSDVAMRYVVVWAKNGMVYGLSGFGTETEALALANSIQ
jgi:hypothetical protein